MFGVPQIFPITEAGTQPPDYIHSLPSDFLRPHQFFSLSFCSLIFQFPASCGKTKLAVVGLGARVKYLRILS